MQDNLGRGEKEGGNNDCMSEKNKSEFKCNVNCCRCLWNYIMLPFANLIIKQGNCIKVWVNIFLVFESYFKVRRDSDLVFMTQAKELDPPSMFPTPSYLDFSESLITLDLLSWPMEMH